jgi:predicted lipoprotein with Yx(FWY)xxD motif
MRNRWLVAPCLAAALVVLAACGSNSPSDPAASNPPASGHADAAAATITIKTMHTSKGIVLATASGKTVYWFNKDTMGQSRCTGSCATYWPPVIGKAAAAAGTSLPHALGTIKRANGQMQVTYDGHPLYTYVGDTAAGQVNGNGLRLSGGLWWAATPSFIQLKHKAAKKKSSSSSGSSGSGGGW